LTEGERKKDLKKKNCGWGGGVKKRSKKKEISKEKKARKKQRKGGKGYSPGSRKEGGSGKRSKIES